MANETKHSPLPWASRPYETVNRKMAAEIVDATGRCIAETMNETYPTVFNDAVENADFIVASVNGYKDLLAEKRHLADTNRALAEETEKTWAKCDELKDLVRRMLPFVEAVKRIASVVTTEDGVFRVVPVRKEGRDDIAMIPPAAIDKIVSDARAAVGEEAGRGNP